MPHSEIPGSPIARISPGLFAACHVLHRLSVPRHPPDALVSRLIIAPPSPAMHTTAAHRAKPPRAKPPRAKLRAFPVQSGERRSRMKTLLSDKPRAMHCRHKACPPRSHHNSLLTLQSTAPRSPAAVSRNLLRTSRTPRRAAQLVAPVAGGPTPRTGGAARRGRWWR